ncbi:hypothetical protein [Dactylosporangium sp. NPDC050588]|uniref:hypothetical protein n=1 Tax=Dactylosporangium sp. NPDC050588 TaxID=3157211 RepID=UPI0033D95EBE
MPSALSRFMAAIRSVKSGGDYHIAGPPTPYGRASGAYQFIDSTWNNFKGYPTARSAPPAVQDQKAAQLMSSYHREFGRWDLVAVAWHAGEGTARRVAHDPSYLNRLSDGYLPTSAYVQRVLHRAGLPPAGGKPGGGGSGGGSGGGGGGAVLPMRPWQVPRNIAGKHGRIVIDPPLLSRLARQLTDNLATVDSVYHRTKRATADVHRMRFADPATGRRLHAALDDVLDGRHGLRLVPGYLSRDVGYLLEARDRALRADSDNRHERRGVERLIASLAARHGTGTRRNVAHLLRDLYRRDSAHTRRHLPTSPASSPSAPRRHGLSNVKLGHAWGGSKSIFDQFVTPFLGKEGLTAGSQKRPTDSVPGPATSDHFVGSRSSYAIDYPTFSGEDEARALARAMGNRSWQPNSYDSFVVKVDGAQFRVQILWGARIDHADHVHVGIHRL